MIYLLGSLLILALTPCVAWMMQHFQKASRIFALVLVLLISYTIFAHIIWENMEIFGWKAVLAALSGALVFALGDGYFLGGSRKRELSFVFLIFIQIFLFFHATIDGAALVSSELPAPQILTPGHRHDQELSMSILMHRMLFEVFIWKFFYDRFGSKAAYGVLFNVGFGTLVGFFGSRLLFQAIPSSFGLFEAFIGGALLHLVYDYVRDRIRGHTEGSEQGHSHN